MLIRGRNFYARLNLRPARGIRKRMRTTREARVVGRARDCFAAFDCRARQNDARTSVFAVVRDRSDRSAPRTRRDAKRERPIIGESPRFEDWSRARARARRE